MTTDRKNSFKELESIAKDELPEEAKEQVIETINSVHQVIAFIAEGLVMPIETAVGFIKMLAED